MLMNMKDLLAVANQHHIAVPAFNISSYAMFNGIMEICEDKRAPVIIEIHPDELAHIGTDMIAAIREKALKATVPVCIHLDHGASFQQVVVAIQAGFTSVMIDGSSLPFDKAFDQVIHYTDPDDAVKFVQETGVDTLAIAIGTCHGLYPAGMKPELKLDILKAIKAKVSIPLVLHGGSNNPDKEIGESVTLGINKINISSDIKAAYYKKMREVLQDLSLREPNVIEPPCIEAMKKVAAQKIELFQDDGKADLY